MMLSYKIKKNTKGATIVSIIVGTALSSFLLAVMLQIFASVKATYNLSKNLSELNDINRHAKYIISTITEQAGYRDPTDQGILEDHNTVFTPFTINGGPIGSEFNLGTYPNSDDPAGISVSYYPGESLILADLENNLADKIWVKFRGSTTGKIRDCQAPYAERNITTMLKIYSRELVPGDSSSVALYCERVDNNSNVDFSVPGQILVPPENFDSLQIRYGEDMSNSGMPTRWVTGDSVNDRNRIKAVRFALITHTKDDVRSKDVTQTFNVFLNDIQRTSRKIYTLNYFTVRLQYSQAP